MTTEQYENREVTWVFSDQWKNASERAVKNEVTSPRKVQESIEKESICQECKSPSRVQESVESESPLRVRELVDVGIFDHL